MCQPFFCEKNKYITQKRAARDQQAAPFCEGGNKMKAEKTPLRYIVQRIMRTIFAQDRQEGVATAGGCDNTFAVADCEVEVHHV